MYDLRLGTTDLQVSAIGLGTWSYGSDWGAVDVTAATDTIHRALELGINLFDTAQAYGFGESERILANALSGRVRREDVVVATKGGLRMDGARVVRDASSRCAKASSRACATCAPTTSTSTRSTGPTLTHLMR